MQLPSLSKFCSDNNISKGSAHRKAQELNIDTSKGFLTVDEQAKLIRACRKGDGEQPEAQSVQVDFTTTALDLRSVETIDLPAGQKFDPLAALAKLDGAKGEALSSPKSLVDMAEMMLQKVQGLLELKIADQYQELDETKAQARRLQRMKAEFDLKAAVAGMESRIVARQQTESTGELTAAYEEVAELGQPSNGQQ